MQGGRGSMLGWSPLNLLKADVIVCVLSVQAKLLTEGGLRDRDICVLAYYSKQVHWIRNILRQKRLGQVSAHYCLTW